MSFLSPELESLFDDEALLPAQYADLVKRRPRSPEHRLLFAVLEDAVRCWQVYESASDSKKERLFGDTAEWFESDSDHTPFTFVAICQHFELDPDSIRCGLRRWSERRRAAPGSVAPLRRRRVAGSRHAVRGEPPKRRAVA